METVKIHSSSGREIKKATDGSAGYDLFAVIDSDSIIIQPGERALIKTGLFMEIPEELHFDIRPRSGLALKKGITVLNTPGLIDSDYRGEIGVILINQSSEQVEICNGDAVAQGVFMKHETVQLGYVSSPNDLGTTARGAGAYGSTTKPK